MDKSNDLTKIFPHFMLMKKYLKIAEKEGDLFDFYRRSLDSFDRIFFNSEQDFAKFMDESHNEPLSGRYIYIILQTKNALDSFYGHYFILKNGLCNASIPNMRFCYETLLKNYFYLTLPYGEKDLVKTHDLRHTDLENKLYTIESLESSHRKLYGMLSKKSHAGIVSSSPSYQCSPETYKDSIEMGIWLLHGYFVFLLEFFNQFISNENRDKIKEFFGEFSKIFEGTFPTFIPDREEINSLLKFKNIGLVEPSNIENLKRDKIEYLENS